MSDKLGTIGTRLDIDIRAGDTLGPYEVEEKDEAGVPLNLTGCTIAGAVSKRGVADADVPLTIVNINLAIGKYSFELATAQSAALVGNDFFKADSVYAWKLTMTMSTGKTYTRYYGSVNVALAALP